MFVVGIIAGVIVLFLLKDSIILGAVAAGFVSGIVSRGPIKGLLAGATAILFGIAILSFSELTASSMLMSFNSTITGLAIAEATPVSFLKSLLSITGVAAGAAAGFVGGMIRK